MNADARSVCGTYNVIASILNTIYDARVKLTKIICLINTKS